ncbi:ABC-three component system protein [Vibrio sp. 10N.222.51.C12]|uniref:ABC-three component system protein n=2 Tax=unclassified Vibrio TaxID=2614977 RepID=UPI0035532AE2
MKMNDNNYVVSVCEGSGVIINPFTDKYSYIFTARHNIQLDIDDPNAGYLENESINVCYENGDIITITDRIISDHSDITILVTETQLESSIDIVPDKINYQDDLLLCGYPRDRRKGDTISFSSISYHFHTDNSHSWIIKTLETVNYDNLVGYSGGAVFNACGYPGRYELRAISSKKSGDIVREFHGDINVIPVNKFIELLEHEINRRADNFLTPIIPYYLSSFTHIKELVFKLSESWDDEEKLNDVCYCLREHGISCVDVDTVNLKPIDIRERFSSYLDCNSYYPRHVNQKGFWSSFFELLIISVILDRPNEVNLDYVENMLKNRQLLYIDSETVWKKHIENILKGQYNGLSLNGAIIVRTLKEDIDYKFDSNRLMKLSDIRDISRKNRKNRHDIDNINRNTKNDRYLIDLGALNRDCLTKREKVFESWNMLDDEKFEQLVHIIEEQYSPILT